MNDAKLQAIEKIETKTQLINDVADKRWEYAELSLQEYKSCRKFKKRQRQNLRSEQLPAMCALFRRVLLQKHFYK